MFTHTSKVLLEAHEDHIQLVINAAMPNLLARRAFRAIQAPPQNLWDVKPAAHVLEGRTQAGTSGPRPTPN